MARLVLDLSFEQNTESATKIFILEVTMTPVPIAVELPFEKTIGSIAVGIGFVATSGRFPHKKKTSVMKKKKTPMNYQRTQDFVAGGS